MTLSVGDSSIVKNESGAIIPPLLPCHCLKVTITPKATASTVPASPLILLDDLHRGLLPFNALNNLIGEHTLTISVSILHAFGHGCCFVLGAMYVPQAVPFEFMEHFNRWASLRSASARTMQPQGWYDFWSHEFCIHNESIKKEGETLALVRVVRSLENAFKRISALHSYEESATVPLLGLDSESFLELQSEAQNGSGGVSTSGTSNFLKRNLSAATKSAHLTTAISLLLGLIPYFNQVPQPQVHATRARPAGPVLRQLLIGKFLNVGGPILPKNAKAMLDTEAGANTLLKNLESKLEKCVKATDISVLEALEKLSFSIHSEYITRNWLHSRLSNPSKCTDMEQQTLRKRNSVLVKSINISIEQFNSLYPFLPSLDRPKEDRDKWDDLVKWRIPKLDEWGDKDPSHFLPSTLGGKSLRKPSPQHSHFYLQAMACRALEEISSSIGDVGNVHSNLIEQRVAYQRISEYLENVEPTITAIDRVSLASWSAIINCLKAAGRRGLHNTSPKLVLPSLAFLQYLRKSIRDAMANHLMQEERAKRAVDCVALLTPDLDKLGLVRGCPITSLPSRAEYFASSLPCDACCGKLRYRVNMALRGSITSVAWLRGREKVVSCSCTFKKAEVLHMQEEEEGELNAHTGFGTGVKSMLLDSGVLERGESAMEEEGEEAEGEGDSMEE